MIMKKDVLKITLGLMAITFFVQWLIGYHNTILVMPWFSLTDIFITGVMNMNWDATLKAISIWPLAAFGISQFLEY